MSIHFATLVMFYVVKFLPILMLSRSFFPNFGQGPFPKIAGKGPDAKNPVAERYDIIDCDSLFEPQETMIIVLSLLTNHMTRTAV